MKVKSRRPLTISAAGINIAAAWQEGGASRAGEAVSRRGPAVSSRVSSLEVTRGLCLPVP